MMAKPPLPLSSLCSPICRGAALPGLLSKRGGATVSSNTLSASKPLLSRQVAKLGDTLFCYETLLFVPVPTGFVTMVTNVALPAYLYRGGYVNAVCYVWVPFV